MYLNSIDKEFVHYIKEKATGYCNLKTLDVGCGTGFYTHFFAEKNEVIGIDLQEVIEKEYRNFDFQKANATNLPFQDCTFDLVISFDVIEHIENDKKMMAEAYRVLKKGGEVFLGTPNKLRLSHFLLKLIGRPVKYPLDLGTSEDLGEIIHIREYTAEELKGLAKKAGFKYIHIHPFWFGLTPIRYGLVDPPKFLQRYCHYFFLYVKK